MFSVRTSRGSSSNNKIYNCQMYTVYCDVLWDDRCRHFTWEQYTQV